ncbi:hypothetical protein MMC09_000726 [Bachmanniomyces sp. S44760]|nr:hypothetical protein [Bachmanniomyces sp. S44760]
MSSNKAAVLPAVGKPLEVRTIEIPKPSESQILIRNYCIATNPVDFKIQKIGFFIKSYPNILGSDVCGIVEAVGDKVTRFKKGDRVSGFAAAISTSDMTQGAFQEYPLLNENCTAKIPDAISYEEGCILPMAVATAGIGIFVNMGIPRPNQVTKAPTDKSKGGFLVWGASSSVGTAAVQIARALGFTVFAVSSPAHFEYNTSVLGAHHNFNHRDSNVIKDIVETATKNQTPIQYAFDAVSEHGTPIQTAKVLESFVSSSSSSSSSQPPKLCLTLPWPEDDAPKPTNIEITNTGAFRIATDSKEFGAWLMNTWLEEALAKKVYVPSPKIEIVKGGLEAVQGALDAHAKGLSGRKLVLPLV